MTPPRSKPPNTSDPIRARTGTNAPPRRTAICRRRYRRIPPPSRMRPAPWTSCGRSWQPQPTVERRCSDDSGRMATGHLDRKATRSKSPSIIRATRPPLLSTGTKSSGICPVCGSGHRPSPKQSTVSAGSTSPVQRRTTEQAATHKNPQRHRAGGSSSSPRRRQADPAAL